MNVCVITGNLGADPESFYNSEGAMITTFHMAFRSGKDKTSWIKVSTFNKLAELAAKCLHKGARVGVTASLDQQKWTGEDGTHRSSFRLIANNLEFIKTDGRGFENKKEDTEGAEGHENQDPDEVPF